jgi:hypothetical protein
VALVDRRHLGGDAMSGVATDDRRPGLGAKSPPSSTVLEQAAELDRQCVRILGGHERAIPAIRHEITQGTHVSSHDGTCA